MNSNLDQSVPAASSENADRRRRWGNRIVKDDTDQLELSQHCIPVVFDMETGDPDDVLTLLLLAASPQVELRAVTITPGSAEQVALVRWILRECGLPSVRVGAQSWPKNADKKCMQGHFYKSFGRLPPTSDVEDAAQVLLACCDSATTLLTGAPLHNLGDALKFEGFSLGRLVAQGGFAGEGVVPPHLQMKKFAGQITCQTWNFNGNIAAAEKALSSSSIGRKVCVSKNVCHSAVYDQKFHDDFLAELAATSVTLHPRRHRALQLVCSSMDSYLQRNPGGKKLHDPLALAVLLDESVCQLVEVELFQDRSGWGSKLSPASGTWISIHYDDVAFRRVLLHHS